MTNLDQSIIEHQKAGWILTYRDQKSAQFRGDKPSAGIFAIIILWILSFAVGIIYLIYSSRQSEPTITLYYDQNGVLCSTKPPKQKGIGFFIGLAIILNILILLLICAPLGLIPFIGESSSHLNQILVL